MATIKESAFLHLKTGIILSKRDGGFMLGLPTRGLLLKDPLHVQIVRTLTGAYTISLIAKKLMRSPDEVREFTSVLSEAGFLDQLDFPVDEIDRTSRDLSQELINARISGELSLLTHREGVLDGGRSEFRRRHDKRILISGENRLARHLLLALHASGFTDTRLIARAHLSPRITPDDICGLIARSQDIGKLRGTFTEDLIRGAQISKPDLAVSDPSRNPDLIISTVPIEWDYVQRWMSEGSVHLHINPVIGREIEIGPLVIPGKDPCLRCVRLIKRDNATEVSLEYIRSQAPTSAISYISGLTALAIGEYFAKGESSLRASSYWYDLLSPLRAPEIRHWNFHPECGCR